MEIYGTLGPSCSSEPVLEKMFRAGMTGVRLNLSHTTLAEASEPLAQLRRAAERCGLEPKLLLDMQGPEMRIGTLPQPLVLQTGQSVCLGGREGLPLPDYLMDRLLPGQLLLLDDGKILLQAEKNTSRARVLRGGTLPGEKSVAVPGADISLPPVSETDRANLLLASRFQVTGVMQPFVRSREDLRQVRQALAQAGCGHVRLFAKIENQQGIDHLAELLPEADEIVIARGDLGNSMPLWELPPVQQKISLACRQAKVPFMVVTQLLSSMETRPVPTRAEVNDIFHAVLDGASSVMVTGETAVGQYPVDVITYLARTVRAAIFYRQSADL